MPSRAEAYPSRCLSVFLAACALALGACVTGGGGSDTEIQSARVTGAIRSLDGLASPRTQVWLIPAGWNPLEDSSLADPGPADSVSVRAGTTDAQGWFSFPRVATGNYNLEAYDPAAGTRCAQRSFRVARADLDLSPDTLRSPGIVVLRLPDSLAGPGGLIYVTGSLRSWPAARAQSRVLLDSLPSGAIAELRMRLATVPARDVVLATGLTVLPGDSTPAGTAHALLIRLNTTDSGAPIANTVKGFPLLVRVSAADLDSGFAPLDSAAIRFTTSEGQGLPFEFAQWNPGGGQASFWVRLDSVRAGSASQSILMHWGPPGAWPAADGGKVFDAASGWVGAWHFDGALLPGGHITDASQGTNSAGWSGPVPAAQNGTVGQAISLNGKDQVLTTVNNFDHPDTFTVALWFKSVSAEGGKLVEFSEPHPGGGPDQNYDRQIWLDSAGHVNFGVYWGWKIAAIPDSITKVLSTPATYNDGAWHYAAASLGPRGQALYMDGVLIASDPAITSGANFSGFWSFGGGLLRHWVPGAATFLAGELDEIRIFSREAGPDWVALSFANQKDLKGAPLLRLEKP